MGPSDVAKRFPYVIVSMTIVFFIAELVVASLLANVTLSIRRSAQLAPVNPPVVTTAVQTQV